MQPGSLPGSREPGPGTRHSGAVVANNSSNNTAGGGSSSGGAGLVHNSGAPTLQAMPSLLSPQQHHHQPVLQFEHAEHAAAPPAMDEFLEQFLSLPPWNDMGGGGGGGGVSNAAGAGGATGGGGNATGRAQWDFSNAMGAAAATRLGVDAHKFITMSLLPIGSHTRGNLQDGPDASAAHVGDTVLYGNDDNILSAARMRGIQDNSPQAPGMASRGTGGGATLTRSPSVGSSGSEGSGGPQSPPPIAPTWRQPYVGGVPPLPLGLGQAKPESLLRGDSGDAHLLGKRPRDEDDVSMREAPSGSNLHERPQGVFASFSSGPQATQTPMPRPTGQPSHQQGNGASSQVLQPGQAMSVYGSQAVAAQPQSGAGVAAISARPRVRARRGQATDPHSIAERLRRERIAERMKALQELVPNSNKTDKASMLDEIIDYVKFLQLQVKVLSMSRLGGAGAVAPLVADLPSEGPSSYVTATMNRSNGGPGAPSQDGLALTERQVARLMEEDMGSAMQYLQSKGLCLMPISLATAISSTSSRSQGGNQGGGAQRSDQSASPAAIVTGSNALTSGSQAAAAPVIDVDKSGSANNLTKDGRDVGLEKTSVGSSSSKQSPKSKTQYKGKEETQRRSQ